MLLYTPNKDRPIVLGEFQATFVSQNIQFNSEDDGMHTWIRCKYSIVHGRVSDNHVRMLAVNGFETTFTTITEPDYLYESIVSVLEPPPADEGGTKPCTRTPRVVLILLLLPPLELAEYYGEREKPLILVHMVFEIQSTGNNSRFCFRSSLTTAHLRFLVWGDIRRLEVPIVRVKS